MRLKRKLATITAGVMLILSVAPAAMAAPAVRIHTNVDNPSTTKSYDVRAEVTLYHLGEDGQYHSVHIQLGH